MEVIKNNTKYDQQGGNDQVWSTIRLNMVNYTTKYGQSDDHTWSMMTKYGHNMTMLSTSM